MSFKFRLQSVLRLQQSLERKQLARLQQFAAVLQRAEGTVQEIRSRLDALVLERQEGVEQGSNGSELMLNHACDQFGRSVLREALSFRETAEREWAAELSNYQSLKLQTERLENVRDTHRKVFEAAERKREQIVLDEMHSLRSHRMPLDEDRLI